MDTTRDVREIQEYLRRIAQYTGLIPTVIPDGIYGPQTRNAVMQFQHVNGLPETGEVDKATWNMIVLRNAEIEAITRIPYCICPFPSADYTVKLGDVQDTVYFIQLIIVFISSIFTNIPCPNVSGVYDETTKEAVRLLQGKSFLEETGDVNKATWDAIARKYNTLRHNAGSGRLPDPDIA